VQGDNKAANEAVKGRDDRRTRYLILAGGLLPVLLAGIVSHVTANALGDLSEARIKESQWHLETIVSKCIDRLQDIALGTEARPAGLRPLVDRHLRVNPPKPDNREIFEWIEARRSSMSDFRHDKLDKLILEARRDYQLKLAELQTIRKTYRKHLESLYAGFWLRRNGYPRIELTDGPKQQ